MQVAKEEGAVAGPTATDDDKDMRRTGSFEAQRFNSPYLSQFTPKCCRIVNLNTAALAYYGRFECGML